MNDAKQLSKETANATAATIISIKWFIIKHKYVHKYGAVFILEVTNVQIAELDSDLK